MKYHFIILEVKPILIKNNLTDYMKLFKRLIKLIKIRVHQII